MSHTLTYHDGSLGKDSTLTSYENGTLGTIQPIQYKSGSLGDAYQGGPNDAALYNGSFGSLLNAYKSGSLGCGCGSLEESSSNLLFAAAGAVAGYVLLKKKQHKIAGAAAGAALGAYFSRQQSAKKEIA